MTQTVGIWLASATKDLQQADIESARLDCLLLLEDALGHDRAWLLAHSELMLEDDIVDELNKKVVRRKLHIPLAYIRGRCEFYGHTFLVNEQVLAPRPESESFLEILATLPKPRLQYATIIDIGTGSGALAISAALAYTEATMLATDIDPHCLALARRNAARLGAVVEFVEADLLQPQPGQPPLPAADIILANLPYVPDDYPINPAASHEPKLALFSGPDGLDHYRRLFGFLSRNDSNQKMSKTPPQFVLTEALTDQHPKLTAIAAASGYQLRQALGLVQLFEFAD